MLLEIANGTDFHEMTKKNIILKFIFQAIYET